MADYSCWCGAVLNESDFTAMMNEVSGRCCGGDGYIDCECGGDFCACHNHGVVACPGCIDCDWEDDDLDDDEPDFSRSYDPTDWDADDDEEEV